MKQNHKGREKKEKDGGGENRTWERELGQHNLSRAAARQHLAHPPQGVACSRFLVRMGMCACISKRSVRVRG